MTTRTICFSLLFAAAVWAQQPSVPRVTNFNGTIKDAAGKPQTGTVGITFALYEEQEGGAPLWSETQNVALDGRSRYTVLLGSTQPDGLPLDLFASGQARWLGVTPQVAGVGEQPRVLLVGVPYALKAADADTLGGLPVSAFLLAPAAVPSGSAAVSRAEAASASPNTACSSVTSDGTATANEIAYFTTACNVEGSTTIVESSGKVGIGTASPATTLEVKGSTTLAGTLKMPSTGAATASTAYDSQPLDLVASAYNTETGAAVPQTFQLQAEPAGNDSGTTSGTLNLLYAAGANTPQTVLQIASNGQIAFATGQAFPITPGGVTNAMLTNSSVTINTPAAGGLTGGGPVSLGTTPLTLSVSSSVVPFLASANTFTGNQTVSGNLSATGTVTGSSFGIGSNLFGFGSYSNSNAFLGFSGNTSASNTGNSNTAAGYQALYANTTGSGNTAVGSSALFDNQTGTENTAIGVEALEGNVGGQNNTATGYLALGQGTVFGSTAMGALALAGSTGSNNTAIGYNALETASTGSNNIALGTAAGSSVTTGSYNIDIGNSGLASDGTSSGKGVIRIGTAGNQASTYIAGIAGVPISGGSSVVVSSTGQLGVGTPTGVGTVTSVSAGTGLTTGSGNPPITTTGTLSLAANACASGSALTALPFTCAPFATLGGNTFTASQTVSNGSLIVSTGSVGIGTSTPAQALEVNGTAQVDGSLSVGG